MYRIKKMTAAFSAVLFLVGTLIYGMTSAYAESELIPETDIKANNTNYHTVHPQIGTYTDQIAINGTAYIPNKTTVLYKGNNATYIKSVAKHGDIVKEGDPLIEIRVNVDEYHLTELDLRIQRAKEDLTSTENSYRLDIQDLQEDLNKLPEDAVYARRAASLRIQKASLELEKFRFEQTLSIEKMQKELDELKNDLEIQYVYSPCDGFIYNVQFYEENTDINTNQVVCTIADISSILIRVSNDHISYGMTANIEAGANKNRVNLPSEVVVSSNVFGEAMNSFALMKPDLGEFDFAAVPSFALNIDRIIFNVSAETVHLENVMVIPKKAVYPDDKDYYVLKNGDHQIINKRYFIPGLENKEQCWVLYGLDETDSLIMN